MKSLGSFIVVRIGVLFGRQGRYREIYVQTDGVILNILDIRDVDHLDDIHPWLPFHAYASYLSDYLLLVGLCYALIKILLKIGAEFWKQYAFSMHPMEYVM